MDWKECFEKRIVKEISEDKGFIKSLIKTSDNKLKSEEKLEINDITAASKLTLAYDSLRELLEALSLKKNFKIYNHECYATFLKEVMNEKELGEEFDDIRKLRNAVNYYGKKISVEEAIDTIKKIKKLRNQVIKLLYSNKEMED